MPRPICQRDFFARLGAPLRHVRQSWGAATDDGKILFLRVWEHEKKKVRQAKFAKLGTIRAEDHPKNRKFGRKERNKHIDLVGEKVKCYLVFCEAKDPDAKKKEIRTFDRDVLFRGGKLETFGREQYIRILEPVRAERLFVT